MINYDIEANIVGNSTIPLVALASLGVLVYGLAKIRHDRAYTALGRTIIPVVLALAFPFLIVASLGPALLAVAGIIERVRSGQEVQELLKAEVLSGALVLRLSSVIIAYHIIRLETKRLSYLFGANPDISKQARELRKSDISTSETQYLFYGICAAALWQNLLGGNVSSYVASFASWAMIYVLDDWTIIQDYLVERNIAPSRWNYYKIFSINVLLLLCLLIIFYSESMWKSLAFFAIPMLCIFPVWGVGYQELRSRIRDSGEP